eukprot:10717070-Heterocapsa_arctica.AAC.1
MMRNSSCISDPVFHCILHSTPGMSRRVTVPLLSLTKLGEKGFLWNQSLRVWNAMAQSSPPMGCEIIFLSVIPKP